MQTDGRTGMKLIVAFRNFANAPKNSEVHAHARKHTGRADVQIQSSLILSAQFHVPVALPPGKSPR